MNVISSNDTIAAVSTPLGEGGIGIVRLSGDDSFRIVDNIFCASDKRKTVSLDTHTIHYGLIKCPETEENIDEVLVSVMKAPNTYTTQDVIEISCHGGLMSLKKVLELCIKSGARLAEPGEFTKRAFLNGRIDLSQAEAVLDVIKSKTDAARHVAVEQLRGVLSQEVEYMRNRGIDILTLIEAGIDFSDEDIEFASVRNITKKIEELCGKVKHILDTSDKGMVLREGASVVICGRPNVGKSSLMNALLRHDRVIVTPIAGTTRDVIEECIDLSGIMIKISDTAGIVDSKDRVEIEGIKRSKERIKNADIVIFMLDASQCITEKDMSIYDVVKDKRTVIVLNKTDLRGKVRESEIRKIFKVKKVVKVSALKKTGLEKVEDALAEMLFGGDIAIPDGAIVTNLRHKKILERIDEVLDRSMEMTGENFNAELLASDINEVVHQLGLIVGKSIEDDILDRIFSQFCIGK